MAPEQPSPNDNDNGRSTIDRFFRGLSECIFHSKLGVADVQMVDYISDLLLRFTRLDATYRVRRTNGKPVTEVFQMLCEAEQRIGLAKREVHRHIGDFTLFWSGMYPESLRKAHKANSPDGFLDYCRQGKRAYAIAATIEGGEDRPSCEVLHRMSEQFEMCAYGLREIRREWEENIDPNSNDGLLLS
ncbi:hypothetical protein N9N28_07645 [Rubripirellula amarantea]|uniref:Uncharacterized protein n=1 Tax=Rubripirellula amarantea TaxID=2527999 RepID=A0A5C5WMG7_9BACT|nr:hypothetical protein [Rubripirellula amarantea]MDA8744488.1 hypothetical protein [Rubripirellula amarantea]TWT51203.1 hypothetical protein Pla22_39800 [Rubripirellula amarantea]